MAVIDALLALRAAASACAAAASSTGFSAEQAANGQAVMDMLSGIFVPRAAIMSGAALEPEAHLLTLLPSEIMTSILHRLDTFALFRFASTCRALYRHAPASIVAVTLQERAAIRGCSVAGPPEGAQGGVPYLLRREWQHTLLDRNPLAAGESSVFIDPSGRLLTCGTEGIDHDDPGPLSAWVLATADPDHEAEMRYLATPTVVPGLSDVSFRGIAASAHGCVAVCRDEGKVYSWGFAGGQLGQDEDHCSAEVDGLAGVRVRSVDLGCSSLSSVFAAVTEQGELYTWGSVLIEDGTEGQNGIGYPVDGQYVETPRQVIISGVCIRSVALGYGFSLILATDGRLFSCGQVLSGALGHGPAEPDVVRPKQIEALQGVRVCGMAAGFANSLALTSAGLVYSWGYAPGTGLGLTDYGARLLPTVVEALAGVRVSMVAAGGDHACAVSEDGELFTWGSDGRYGSLGHGDEAAQPAPRRVEALRGCRIAVVSTGEYHTLAAGEGGSVYGFGLSSRLGLGIVSHESQLTPVRIPNLKVWLG